MAAILRASVSRAISGFMPLSSKAHIKLAERPHPTAGSGSCSLEDLFHFVVVILIQTTNLLRFFRTLQLSADKAVLRTVARLDAQPTVGPQLSLAPEPVRGLHQRQQAGCPNRTDAGNLSQQFRGFMFPALRQ